jgi:hypothetical protein
VSEVASLYGPDSGFPVDAVAKSEPGEEAISGSGYRFGVSSKRVAERLRKIADAIESTGVAIQGFTETKKRDVNDFALTETTIIFAEPEK